MLKRLLITSAATLFVLTGAAASAAGPSGASAPTLAAPDHLPPPFTAAQLRAGIPAGTEMKLKIEGKGQPTVVQHWVFTSTTDKGCAIHAQILDESGKLVRDNGEGTSTWEELEAHAHFPKARSTVTEGKVEVLGTSFDAWRFEVKPEEKGGATRTYHFAKALPGPPVLMVVERDGEVKSKMTLISRTPPKLR